MSFLQELFLNVVNMSITASYVAIGVILVRLLLKKAPKVFSYILWIPVLFRLVCPFSFDSAFSFFNLINLNAKQGSGVSEFVPQNIGLMQTPVIQSGIGSIDSAANASLPSAIPVASANPMQVWLAVFSLIWVFGVIALFIYSIISYVKIKRKLQTATRVDGNVFETDAIGTAFVCGFIRPKIYVPANIGDANLSYILEHEHTHIRRKDYLIKPIAFLALILHWFNPLMWLCFALMSRDMEMSCDESVLRRLGDGAKGGYSNSLLSLSVKRKGLLAANPLAFGENHAKARIRNVLNFKKPAFWVIVAAVAAVCVAGFAFAANPSESAAYISEDYKISFKYPSSWKLNPNYIERYEGKDGFFQVGAINGENMSIDEVAKNDAFHKLNPYGSDPKIINRTIDGQEARLILPSADQPEEMKNQAGLIIKYPKAIKIDGSQYRYFILWADKTHIDQISNTLTFLIKQAGDENSPDKIASLIEENLAAIMSSPKNSSNPQDYINAHQTEYEAILALETQALPYLFAEFEKGGQTGLKGYIMQNLCWDILGEDNIQYASKDPQDWYDTFKEHVQRTAASSTLDFVKANNPKYGALLDVINTPGAERIAKFVEENRFQEVLTSLQSIPQEKIAFCLFEVDTWNIPEEDLISKPKPYSAYFFDSDDEVLYLLHEKDYLKKDEKMLCAFRCNEAKDVYKSEDSILTIEQEFGGQINNELYYARIPDLDKISLELLENELLKVKYSNQEKIINKNDSLNDELLLIVDDKEYKIKITIKNFGLIDKTQIKTRHPLE